MSRRPLPLALAACLFVAPAPATDIDKPRQHFAAHCEAVLLPNFTIPLKSIGSRDGLTYSDGTPDASGVSTIATLARPGARIQTRFGQPQPGDVEVSAYGDGGRRDEDAYGRIVALFRFCEPRR